MKRHFEKKLLTKLRFKSYIFGDQNLKQQNYFNNLNWSLIFIQIYLKIHNRTISLTSVFNSLQFSHLNIVSANISLSCFFLIYTLLNIRAPVPSISTSSLTFFWLGRVIIWQLSGLTVAHLLSLSYLLSCSFHPALFFTLNSVQFKLLKFSCTFIIIVEQ